MPENYLEKYFEQKDDQHYAVKDFVRQNVVVKHINLIQTGRFERKLDYIFCRNVLIYFDQETQKKVVESLIENLDPLGYLFVGHSESLFFVTDKIESVFVGVYNKKE